MTKSLGFKIARLVVSAGLIVFLIARQDISQVGRHLKGLALLPLALAAVLDLAMIVANSLRWKVLLAAKGISVSTAKLVYYYLVSIFFSSFLPTSVGGDFARIVAVSAATDKRADAFASVVVERLMGFFVLLPLSLVAIALTAGRLKQWDLVLTAEIFALLLMVAAAVLLVRPVARGLSRVLDPLLGVLARVRARERLASLYEAIVSYRGAGRAVLAGLALSVASRLLWIWGCYLIAGAFGLNLGFAVLLLVVPIVEIARMIPISISGIGVREAAFIAMLGQFGVDDSLGFAFGLVVYVVFFVFAIIGGTLYGARSIAGPRASAADSGTGLGGGAR